MREESGEQAQLCLFFPPPPPPQQPLSEALCGPLIYPNVSQEPLVEACRRHMGPHWPLRVRFDFGLRGTTSVCCALPKQRLRPSLGIQLTWWLYYLSPLTG